MGSHNLRSVKNNFRTPDRIKNFRDCPDQYFGQFLKIKSV
ncbi:Uncharacterized protein dnm_075790 [Desulfonema magnum]|uniref:Uncharacterized protein n=1 Tax=Desulfonema magnum TaxID=45655 RepID=A0A975GRX6_9BACT|nr:Uncharacterized protein dnm_075790 [Desulfonema magnum]